MGSYEAIPSGDAWKEIPESLVAENLKVLEGGGGDENATYGDVVEIGGLPSRKTSLTVWIEDESGAFVSAGPNRPRTSVSLTPLRIEKAGGFIINKMTVDTQTELGSYALRVFNETVDAYNARAKAASERIARKGGVDVIADAAKAEGVLYSQTFEELYSAIAKLGSIVGSTQVYAADELVGIIEGVRGGSLDLRSVTNAHRIREKVDQLLKAGR